VVRQSFAQELRSASGQSRGPFSSGKTSIRGGFGIFDDEILPKYYFFSGSLNPPYTSARR